MNKVKSSLSSLKVSNLKNLMTLFHKLPSCWLKLIAIFMILISIMLTISLVPVALANERQDRLYPAADIINRLQPSTPISEKSGMNSSAMAIPLQQGQTVTRTWDFESGEEEWIPLDGGHGLPFWEQSPTAGPGVGVWRAPVYPSGIWDDKIDVFIIYPYLVSLDAVIVDFYTAYSGTGVGGARAYVWTSTTGSTNINDWTQLTGGLPDLPPGSQSITVDVDNKYVMIQLHVHKAFHGAYGYVDNVTFVNCIGCDPGNSIPIDQIFFPNECPFCGNKEKGNYIGDPINTLSGNYGYAATDISLPTVGQPLKFERSYNSLATLTDTVVYSRPLGYGWTHNYDIHLTFEDDPYGEEDTVILKAPHGSRLRFTEVTTGTYEPFPGVWAEMTRQGTTAPYTYVVTATNQTVYTFVDAEAFAPLTFTAKLTATDATANEGFGYHAVAVSGDTAIIGAYQDDDNGPDSGSAYIFVRNGTTWSQQAKLLASDETGQFGFRVDISGDTAIIGAPQDDDNGPNSGAAYIFVRNGTTWSQQAKLTPGDENSLSGPTVAIDGDTVIIGAPGDDDNGYPSSGAAYIFVRNGTTWSQQAKLKPSDGAAHDEFGLHSVAIDGETVIIGKPNDYDNSVPAAYIFVRNGTTWGQQAKLTVNDGGDAFGYSVDVRGDYAAMGAYHGDKGQVDDTGAAYIFGRNGTTWSQQVKLNGSESETEDVFGVDVSLDEDIVIVGSIGDDDNGANSGSAYIFERNGATWSQQTHLLAHDGVAQDDFGFGVDIDGGTAIVGASGKAYIFEPEAAPSRALLASIRDPQGNLTNFAYNGFNLAHVEDEGSGRYLNFAYDGQDRLISVTDHTSRTVQYGYDLTDNLSIITDTRNLTWTYSYTGAHLLHEIEDPDGKIVERTFFDPNGRAVRQEDGLDNALVEINYASATTRVITEAGKVYTDTYDSRNLLISQTNKLGEVQNYEFDGDFNRNFTKDGEENETHYLRDALGRTLVMTDANGITTTFSYSGATTNILTMRDGRGHTTAYSYDGNNLKTTTNPLNGTTVYTYNTAGQVTATQDENGNVTQYAYDSLGNRTVITDALNNDTGYQYDSLGRVITTTDAQNKITVNHYDAADHLIQVTENYAAGQGQNYQDTYNLMTRYGYDGAGRQTVITDTLNRVSRNFYDEAGRLEKSVENYQDGAYNPAVPDEDIVSLYGYDEFGRLETTTDTLGHVNKTSYDEAGRIHQSIANFEDGAYDSGQPDEDIITEFVYDSSGNVVETIELPGETEERRSCTVYDNLNRVERTLVNCVSDPDDPENYSEAADEDLVTRYVYDAVGNQIEIYDPLDRKTAYTYDVLNRVITMTNPAGDFTTYGYDAASNRTRVTDANQHDTFYAYDQLNRVVTTTDHLNGQTVVHYDAVGNRTQTIDAENRVTTYTYDSIYRLTQLTDANNQEMLYAYDALGNRLAETDAEAVVTRFEYDRLNRLITTTQNYDSGSSPDFETNVKTGVTYNGLGWRTQVTDGRGKSTQSGYDGLGRTLVITDALAHTTEYSYDGHGNRRSVTNGENETTEFDYDGVDRLSLISDPLGNETEYHYNKAGERTGLIDAEAVETLYGYDNLGRLISVTENYQQSGPVDEQTNVLTQYGYDKVGNRTVITDARSYTTTYEYDALNRRIEMTNALGHQTRYAYDKVGNQKVLTDANTLGGLGGAVTQFDYDALNRLIEIDYSDSTPDVTFTYDSVGNRETMTDGTGTTTYLYDKLYRLSSVTDGNNQTVGYGHDEVGNRTELIYPDSQQVSYDYDDANRLDTVTADWLNGQFGYNYDEANRLTGLELPNGVTSGYTYDNASRLALLTHTLAITPLASYAYSLDNVGNRRVLTESLVTVPDQVIGAYLESGGLVVLEAEHYVISTTTVSHQWQLQTGQSGYTGTGYLQPLPDIDALYQTTELANSPRVDYPIYFTTPGTYTLWLRGYPANAAGDSLHIGLNGVITTVTGFGPEAWEWGSETTNSQPFTVAITSADLYTVSLWLREDGLRVDQMLLTTNTTYVPSGFLAETERLSGGGVGTLLTRTIVYTYDNLYRLTQAEYTTGESYQYGYDEVGNRLEQIIDGDTTDYLYDEANRLEAVTHLSVTQPYTFSANGNLLATGVMTNSFDAANRLVSSSREGTTVEPIYNGGGDRVGQTIGTTTTHFALDVQGLPEVIYTSEGELYLHLPGVIVTEKAGEVRYLLSDGLGSIRQAVDGTGALVAYNEYDPWGSPVQEGSQPYGFSGEWWQEEVDLLHLRARWYAPEIGGFLSRDPVESEPPYQYVRGNPVSWVDPDGQDPCSLNNPTQICHSQPSIGTITTNPVLLGSEDSFIQDMFPTGFPGIDVIDSIDHYLKGVYVIQASHALNNDDGIVFGLSGGASTFLTQGGMSSPQAINTFLVAFDDICLSATGKTGGFEIVYDFKHQERGLFWYDGNLLNIGTVFNSGLSAYVGKTRGFAKAGYSSGVDAYSGPFASIALNLGHKSGPPFGAVFIEAAPLFPTTNKFNPEGVFATYYGVGGGTGVGGPINADIAATNYTLLQRQRYLLGAAHLVDNSWASWVGFRFTEDSIINFKQKDIIYRKSVAALMTNEIIQLGVLFSPSSEAIVPKAIIELWDFADDTSE